MNITTFTVDGPALTARIPLPCPVETPVRPYPWSDFMTDMENVLDQYASSEECEMTMDAMMRHLAEDGTCYWIRADLDSGPRFLRVFVSSHDPDHAEVSLAIDLCSEAAVPGRLRLN